MSLELGRAIGLKGPNTFMKHSFYNKYAINTMYIRILYYVVRKSEGTFLENADVHYV